MKDFFKIMFASTLGENKDSVILTALSFMFFIGIAMSFSSEPAYSLQKNTVLKINLNGIINDKESTSPLNFLMSGTSIPTYGLNDILSAIKKAKGNSNINGIYINAGQVMTGYATIQPIHEALIDFKESGKFIVAYGENFNHRSYFISSVADEIYMNPDGVFDFRGLATSIQFNKEVYEKWGIEMQVFKVGTFKSAVEPFIETKMSDANRQQVTSYLNDIWGTLLSGISEGRGISTEQLNGYADECLTFAPSEKIVEYNLIDGLKYGVEMDLFLKNKLGLKEEDNIRYAGVKNMKSVPDNEVRTGKDRIAILYAEGDIVADQMESFYSGSAITAKKFVRELTKLKEDKNVKAVVFRVNSPGGSAYASEQIWHAVKELKKVKPVVVSMGDYAASGGYYISCGADKIIAEPNTLTGSIGIFGIIPNGAQLAKKMGATHDGVSTNRHSNFADDVLSIPLIGVGLLPARPLNTEEGIMVQAYIERGYDQFLSRCAEGRGKTKEEIDAIGQGRVWTGKQALGLGLIDELGDINTAIKAAAELAQLENYSIKEYPAQKDFFSSFLEDASEGISQNILKGIVGKETYEQKKLWNAWQNYDCKQAIISEIIQ
ncbi:MAG: signal peptide peptidase SppA [Bacteroidales bacterium]|nr:signal peptide peptidase SppA [Bacteroidales bacterium]